MGRKLDALLGRKQTSSKLKPTINLATSRLTVLKNQRLSRLSGARSDVLQLLNLGHHERALLRVEQVIKEQNMVDAFLIIQSHLDLLIERANLVEYARECPDELKEAISSLLFASTRCGEFPELREIREILTSRFGKEFAGRAIELRNNCGVSVKLIQKLSTKQPSLESRLKALEEIASENEIVLQIEGVPSAPTENKINVDMNQNQPGQDMPMNPVCSEINDNAQILREDMKRVEDLADSVNGRRKYKDVADAAQAAFESAAYAAHAARAAVELSRSGSFDPDDDQNKSNKSMRTSLLASDEKIHPVQNSESEDDIMHNTNTSATKLKRSSSYSSSDSGDDISKEAELTSQVNDQRKSLGKEIVIDESDDDYNENTSNYAEGSKIEDGPRLNLARRPLSVRARRIFGRR